MSLAYKLKFKKDIIYKGNLRKQLHVFCKCSNSFCRHSDSNPSFHNRIENSFTNQIRFESSFSLYIRMTDLMTYRRYFPSNWTKFRHKLKIKARR